MDDRKLKTEIQHVLEMSLSGIQDDPLMVQRVLLIAREKGGKMKRKASISIAFALALMLAFGSIATALTMNLFERFGQNEQQRRLNGIASVSEIDPPASNAIHSEQWGDTTLSFTNAYYDGDALLIGYSIENSESICSFAPAVDYMNTMILNDGAQSAGFFGDQDTRFRDEYGLAMRDAVPFGLAKSTVVLSTSWVADGGIILDDWDLRTETPNGEQKLYLLEFSSLPEAVRYQESISLNVAAIRQIDYLYFDGQNTYSSSESFELETFEVSVVKTSGEVRRFEGKATIDGERIFVDAAATDVRLTVQITALDGSIPVLQDGLWYDMCLRDEADNLYEAVMLDERDGSKLVFTFDSLGELPNELTAYLLTIGDEAGTASLKIALDPTN